MKKDKNETTTKEELKYTRKVPKFIQIEMQEDIKTSSKKSKKSKKFIIIGAIILILIIAMLVLLSMPKDDPNKINDKPVVINKNEEFLNDVSTIITKLNESSIFEDEDILLEGYTNKIYLNEELYTELDIDSSFKGYVTAYYEDDALYYVINIYNDEFALCDVRSDKLSILLVLEDEQCVEVIDNYIYGSGSTYNYVMNNNSLYSFGENTYGQLGIGNNVTSTQPVLVDKDFDSPIKSVALGYKHNFILLENNALFAVGDNTSGQFGNGANGLETTFTKIQLDYENNTEIIYDNFVSNDNYETCKRFKTIEACIKNKKLYIREVLDEVTLKVIDNTNYDTSKSSKDIKNRESNDLYNVSSDNSIREIGYFVDDKNQATEIYIITNNKKILLINKEDLFVKGKITILKTFNFDNQIVKLTQVIENDKYTMQATDTNGNVYIVNNDGTFVTKKVDTSTNLDAIKKVDVGFNFSVLLLENGKVYTTGSNVYGELGNNTNTNTNKFSEINKDSLTNKKVKDISVGYNHTLLLTEDNQVYGFGNNSNGQLGITENTKCSHTDCIIKPTLINNEKFNNEKIISIYAFYNYSVFVSENNNIYVTGSNTYNKLSTDEFINILTPIKLNFETENDIVKVVGGLNHISVLLSNNEVYMIGTQLYTDNLLNEQYKSFTKLEIDFEVIDIYSGINHTMLVDKDNNIYLFGSNKYGQLGNNSTIDDNVTQILEF